jgi:spore maturation protein CgeB
VAIWIANYDVPRTFAQYKCTVHVPRRAYARSLPGIPTIRMFEAMACGIPLVSAPWNDSEHLFRPGADYLIARDGAEMRGHLQALLSDPAYASSIAASGLETIRSRHTCAHRVDELFAILSDLGTKKVAPRLREANRVAVTVESLQ